jgi:excisionase family DNA binding protein
MMYPLVNELAADGIAVVVTCRVLKLARQSYYRWLAHPVGSRELDEAYLANALFDAHADDPEFGYRLLADEAREAGLAGCDRTVWRICAANQWWSVFGKPRGHNGKRPGPPSHDDLVKRDFTAQGPNQLWLTDITEHPTGQGKVYLCAIKDEWSNRIVGYSISDRMKSQIAVDALNMTLARRGPVTGCIIHSDRGSQFRSRKFPGRAPPPPADRIEGPSRLPRRQRRHGILLRTPPKERPRPAPLDHPPRTPAGDHHLDRTHLPPPTPTSQPRPIDPHRIRNHHDHTGHPSHLTQPVTQRCISPQQAAGLHGVSVDTLRRRIREGRLPAYRFGDRLIKVRIADLENLFHPIPVGQQLRPRVS